MNSLPFTVLISFFTLSCNGVFRSSLYSSMQYYPANGISGGKIILDKSVFNIDEKFENLQNDDLKKIQVIKKEQKTFRETLLFKSTLAPGPLKIRTTKGKMLDLVFYKDENDVDMDGFPDRAELKDSDSRQRFLSWFVRIADSQYLKKNYSWNKSERDCAGLIRYAYREALKKHDNTWLKSSGIVLDKNLADVAVFNYPEIPVIGNRLFKISSAEWQNAESFSSYADAEHLMKYNTAFISRNISDSKTGDILFFFDQENMSSPYHSMVVAEVNPEVTVIYHTGSEAGVKRIHASELEKTRKFSPNIKNPNFAGVFRFHIVN